jgi:hypothetical protein
VKEASAIDVKKFTEKNSSCIKQCLLRIKPPSPKIKACFYQKIRFLKAFQVCYRMWSGFLTFRKQQRSFENLGTTRPMTSQKI